MEEKITISKEEYDKAVIAAGEKLLNEVEKTTMSIIIAGIIYAKEIKQIIFKEENEDGSK